MEDEWYVVRDNGFCYFAKDGQILKLGRSTPVVVTFGMSLPAFSTLTKT